MAAQNSVILHAHISQMFEKDPATAKILWIPKLH